MPIKVERELKESAEKKYRHIKDPKKRQRLKDAYVFGYMRHKLGWKPEREK